MREKDYLKRWILPEQGLNEDEPDLKTYVGRPVGDSPELVNWDSTLNKDCHETVNKHVAMTADLDEDDDENKFSLATPNKGTSAYLRILDPETGVCPTSARIIEDTNKVYLAMDRIIKAKGCVVPDINTREGHRADAAREGMNDRRGGYHPRKLAKDDYGSIVLHPNAKKGTNVKMEGSRAKFNRDRGQQG